MAHCVSSCRDDCLWCALSSSSTSDDDDGSSFMSSSSSSSSSSSETTLVHQKTPSEEESSSSVTPNSKLHHHRAVKGVASRTCPLNEQVARLVNVTLEEANELIAIGAVWARMDTLTEEDVLSQYYDDNDRHSASTTTTSVMYSDLPKGWKMRSSNRNYNINNNEDDDDEEDEGDDLEDYVERMAAQRYRRILTPSMVEAGTDMKVYPNPRRFPSCYELTPDRLLYEDTTFLVVDKPPMLPTQPDASNYFECCPGCVHDLLGPFTTITGQPVLPRPLLCHRVDSCVGGCVVLSKDRNGQRVFHDLQRQRKLKKLYLAVTTEPVPVGMHLHWMWAPQTTARGRRGGPPCQLVSHTPPASRRKARQFWTRCVLEVTKCEPIEILVVKKEQDDGGHTSYDPGGKPHYQSTIRLVTGRKHQVRAQLASLGCPIIRDTLYEPMAGYTFESLQDDEEGMDIALGKCRIPTEPIGLQAHAILFGGIRAKANTPWWGDRVISTT